MLLCNTLLARTAVIHDLNLAARFSDRLPAMKDGGIRYEGNVDSVMTKQMLAQVFGLDAYIVEDPWSKKKTMLTYQTLSKNNK